MREQLSWPTLDTRLQWSNLPTTAWAKGQLLVRPAQALLLLLLVEPLVRLEATVDNTLVDLPAPMPSPQGLARRLGPTQEL